ncbi:MAG: hypothetical protein KatS3mg124_1322 [Porticoccaceae bacterium]|nr:MAG: hypothetical protein KatS3mg124_1322 [Porticoccaceae bacterium]
MSAKNFRSRRLSVAVALAAGTLALDAFGQSRLTRIEEIVVTARRVEESAQDVPISMTLYTQEDLHRRNISIPTDLGIYTPSLSVNERFGPEKASFSIRGFNQELSTAPTVGVYFAEVVGVRAQGGTTSGNTVGAGAFTDLENVQILKGPQGTLFGRNTDGGAVLLQPTKPTEELEGYLEGSVGNYDLERYLGVLNLPFSESFRMRFVADVHKRDGYMKNRSPQGPDFNDRNYDYLRVSAVWQVTPELENYTLFHVSDSNTHGYGNRYVACNRALQPVAGRISLNGMIALAACEQIDRQAARGDGKLEVEIDSPGSSIRLDQWQFINHTTWEVSDRLTLKNIFSYGEFKEDSRFSLYGGDLSVPASVSFLDFGAPFPFPVTPGREFRIIELDGMPRAHNAAQQTWTEELQLQGNALGERLRYVAGFYLEFSEPNGFSSGRTARFTYCDSPADLRCDFTTIPLAGSISETHTKFDFENHGVFAQGSYDLTEQWTLTLGARYTFDKIKGYSESLHLAVPPLSAGPLIATCRDVFRFPNRVVTGDRSVCGVTLKEKSNEPTWLVDLEYKPQDGFLGYLKYARGYRQGGMNFTNPGLEIWKPEEVDSYEIGAKWTFAGDRVSGQFNVAAFYNDYTDQQVFGAAVADRTRYPGISGGAAILNAGESEISGVEVESVLLFPGDIRLSLSYAYLDTEIKKLDTSGIDLTGTPFLAVFPLAVEGDPLNLAPDHKLSANLSWRVPLAESLGELVVGATYTYVDEQLVDTNLPSPWDYIDSYDLLDLNLDWRGIAGSAFDLALFATNVTNEKYPVATGGGWSSFGIVDYLYGQPRMYGARLRYNFGGR